MTSKLSKSQAQTSESIKGARGVAVNLLKSSVMNNSECLWRLMLCKGLDHLSREGTAGRCSADTHPRHGRSLEFNHKRFLINATHSAEITIMIVFIIIVIVIAAVKFRSCFL